MSALQTDIDVYLSSMKSYMAASLACARASLRINAMYTHLYLRNCSILKENSSFFFMWIFIFLLCASIASSANLSFLQNSSSQETNSLDLRPPSGLLEGLANTSLVLDKFPTGVSKTAGWVQCCSNFGSTDGLSSPIRT